MNAWRYLAARRARRELARRDGSRTVRALLWAAMLAGLAGEFGRGWRRGGIRSGCDGGRR